MTDRPNIIDCTLPTADASIRRPLRLREAGVARVLGRRIVSWKSNYGSYGMGGPGFFGMELAARDSWPAEHLVLTLWAAAEWLMLDSVWVEAHPNQFHLQRPLFANFGPEESWDDVTPRLVGGTIERFDLAHASCRILVRNGAQDHLLELPRNTAILPLRGGSMTARKWNPLESVIDAWTLSDGELEC
jgi:hypothetical protein